MRHLSHQEMRINIARHLEFIQGFITNRDAEERFRWFEENGASAHILLLLRTFQEVFQYTNHFKKPMASS